MKTLKKIFLNYQSFLKVIIILDFIEQVPKLEKMLILSWILLLHI